MNIELLTDHTADQPQTFPEGSFLQSECWASFKSQYGWSYLRFFCAPDDTDEEFPSFILTVLMRSIPFFGTLCYIPGGPETSARDEQHQGRVLAEIACKLRRHLPADVICVRFDPLWEIKEHTDGSDSGLLTVPVRRYIPASKLLRKAETDIQPPDTVILDLTPSPDEILASMKPKCRYNCKLGPKKGLVIRCIERIQDIPEALTVFYSLYEETAKRDGIAIHSKQYYLDLFETIHRCEHQSGQIRISIRMYIAEHESVPIASIIVLLYGSEAVYLYGASSNSKRNLMPAYALQWQAICDARDAGCVTYDFYGIPPTNDPEHPMYGLYRFKTGFGGWIVHRPGSYDAPINRIRYVLFVCAQKARTVWFKKIVKKLRKGIRHSS